MDIETIKIMAVTEWHRICNEARRRALVECNANGAEHAALKKKAAEYREDQDWIAADDCERTADSYLQLAIKKHMRRLLEERGFYEAARQYCR